MARNLITAALACVAVAACADPKVEKERKDAAARAKITAESTFAAATAYVPNNGKWDKAQLAKSLINAGLAPQRVDSVRAQSFMGAPVVAYQLGVATLYAYIYADSTARRSVVARLDRATLAPPGTASPYALPRELVLNNNLAAVVSGGTDRQRERITIAIAAGPAPP